MNDIVKYIFIDPDIRFGKPCNECYYTLIYKL